MSDKPHPPTFRLAQWHTLRMQLLWVYERDLREPQEGQMGTLDYHSLLKIRKGWAEAGRSKRKSLRGQKGDWLILQQGERWQRFAEDSRVLSIGFRFQLPTGEPIYDRGLPLLLPAGTAKDLDRAATQLVRIAKQTVGMGFSCGGQVANLQQYLDWQGAFRTFLGVVSCQMQGRKLRARGAADQTPVVSGALEWIAKLAPTYLLRASQISRKVGLSTVHLNRLMLRDTGRSIRRHIDDVRLRLSRDLLREEGVSVKAVAYRMGFSTPSHFQTWFKKHQKVTPKTFQSAHLH